MATYDCYGEARRLIAMMKVEGFSDAAATLDDAIKAGFTASEILMALRWQIDRFLAPTPDCSDDLLKSARNLRGHIDELLK